MKFKKAGLIAAVIMTAVAVSAMIPVMARVSGSDSEKGKITVNGEGKVNVVPDVAYIIVGVTNTDADAKKAQEENSKAMAKMLEAIKEQGIPESDIQTTGYSIYPVYDRETYSTIEGYTVNNNINVTVKDLDKIGSVLETALDNGGNIASGINFSVIDSAKAYEEALALAIENAIGKGEAIAKAISKTVNKTPVEVFENGGNYVPYARNEAMMAGGMIMKDAGAGYIQAGELNVTANIQAVFEFE